MRSRLLVAAGLAAALALPATALGKGPATASISGPGLKGALPIKGDGEGGPDTPLGAVVSDGGYFPAMFGQSPDPMLRAKPQGKLGPRYTITYVVPGPNNTKSTIRQQVYPYATPTPVTYTKPGQPFWGSQKTYGGWYQAPSSLRTTLVAAGLPRRASAVSSAGSSGLSTGATVALAVAIGLVPIPAASFLVVRRRRRRGENT